MKAVMIVKRYNLETKEPGAVACIELPKPQIREPDDILIRVRYSSICGSDANNFRTSAHYERSVPRQLGHEMVGVIEDMGAGTGKKGLKAGDIVTGNFFCSCGLCDSCVRGQRQFCTNKVGNSFSHAEYLLWKESQIYKIPEGTPMLQACLAEPFTIAMGAVEKSAIRTGAHVAISGGGGIGLMAAQLAKMMGAAFVTVIEPVKAKHIVAKQMGADYIIDPVNEDLLARSMELTHGHGFDAVLESSGSAQAAANCLKIAARGGTVIYFAMYKPEIDLSINMYDYFYHKEIRLQGMFLAVDSFYRAVQMLPRMNFSPIISKLYRLENCVEAFEEQASGKYVKLVFDCSPS